MTNRPRAKGTRGETELLRYLNERLGGFRRTPASTRWDLERDGEGVPIHVVATRPDRGSWIFLVSATDFTRLVEGFYLTDPPVHVEVKRRKTYAHHSLFDGKVKGGATTQPEP